MFRFVSLAAFVWCIVSPAQARAEASDKKHPVIQIAILLDTSNSMDGLIDQAKSQLWKIVNELASCKRGGLPPELQVALYEYGKQSLPAESQFIRQITPFTTDLDKVSEELFALRTNGGEEFCGAVIERAVRDLAWSTDPTQLRAIFIAGNEPFTQGPTDYRVAVRAAIEKGILVNTIHCGPEATGIGTGWRDGALLADGSYMNIDQNKALTSINAPQDKEIAELTTLVNATYVHYGKAGEEAKLRQQMQDENAAKAASKDALVQRAMFKNCWNYSCSTWDLVDGCRDGKVKLEELKDEELPEEMRKMTLAERKAFVEKKARERAEIQAKVAKLTKERAEFVAKEQQRLAAEQGEKSLDAAIIESLRKQAERKEFRFEGP